MGDVLMLSFFVFLSSFLFHSVIGSNNTEEISRNWKFGGDEKGKRSQIFQWQRVD